MKAVLYRKTGLPAGKEYDKIVLSESAVAVHVNGEFVTVQNANSVHMVAAVKLSEHDHIKLEA